MDVVPARCHTRRMLFDLPAQPAYFGPEHEDLRRSVRAFVEREIAPHVAAWDEAGTFPRELYRQAGAAGLLGIGYPEELGGAPADVFFTIAAAEEIARAGSGGVQASLGSHHIALPPVVACSLVPRSRASSGSVKTLPRRSTRMPSIGIKLSGLHVCNRSNPLQGSDKRLRSRLVRLVCRLLKILAKPR